MFLLLLLLLLYLSLFFFLLLLLSLFFFLLLLLFLLSLYLYTSGSRNDVEGCSFHPRRDQKRFDILSYLFAFNFNSHVVVINS